MPEVDLGVYRQIREILNNFDFNRVHDIMEFMGWKYSFGEGHNRVPTVDDLKKHAGIMLMFIARANGGTHHLKSGGFSVEQYYTDQGNKMSLEFIVESFESEPFK